MKRITEVLGLTRMRKKAKAMAATRVIVFLTSRRITRMGVMLKALVAP